MAGDGLLIGEIAKRSGASRKALRLYEAAGILPAARRTAAGYRIYGIDTLAVLSFVRQAQRLGFTLGEIKEIVAIREAGRPPCRHIRDLVRRKVEELDQQRSALEAIQDSLQALLTGWRARRLAGDAVCPNIERIRKGDQHGEGEDVTVSGVHLVSRSRDRRRRGSDR
ncbi:MAG: MerR family DNA-binding protein [Candidatus Rokuibacteriota bacterium]